jgi:hypothetical protein
MRRFALKIAPMKRFITGFLVILACCLQLTAKGQSIGLRIPDTTLQVGNSVWLPVYVDSSLSGRQVFSFQIQLLHNTSYLVADSIRTQGTLSANALPTANFGLNGVVNVAGASAMPLSGSGVLFYIRYRVVTTYGGYTTPVNFSAASATYFNQGSPAILFDGGNITVPSLPNIGISPGNGQLVIGDTLNFTASGGTPPYQWRLADTTAGQLLPLNSNSVRYVPLSNRSTRIIATDSNGFSGQTSQPIQSYNFHLQLQDTNRFQGSEILYPIRVSDLSAFQVVSGSFTLHLGTAGYLQMLGLETDATLLQSAGLVQYASNGAQSFNISFANSTPLQGSGVLLYVRLKLLVPFASDFFAQLQLSNAQFNQGLTALTRGATIRGLGLPQLSINPNSGTLVAGESRQLSVINGFGPFQWSTTDSNLATINAQGLLTARQGGQIQVQVSDSLGASRISGNFDLYDTRIYLRDTVAIVGDSLITMAVYMDALPLGKTVNAFNFSFNFDASRLDSFQLIQANTLSQGWAAAINRTANNAYAVAVAGAQGQSQGGILCYLRFKILPNFLVNQTISLSQLSLLLNEGNPNALLVNGNMRLLPCNPSATVSPSGTQTYCASQPGTLSGPSGTAYQYQWYRNGQAIPTANQRQWTPNQSGAYTLQVSLNSQCFVVSDTVHVLINPSPVANILPYADTLRACSGDTLLLATAGGPGYSYQWFRNGNTIAGATDSTYKATLAGNYTVRTSLNGCQTTSNAQAVYFRPLPVKPVIQWSGLAVCAGDSTRLNIPQTPHLIMWMNASGQQLGGNDTAIWVGPGRYLVSLTDVFGCTILSDTIQVVAATANAQIDPSGPTTFCVGGSVNLDLTQQASYIRWYRNGVLLTDTVQPIRVDSAGDYWATYRLPGNICLFTSPVMTIQVLARPVAELDTLQPLCVNDSARILTEGLPVGGVYFGPGVQQGVFYPALAGVGVHQITYVYTANGCSDTASSNLEVFALPNTSLAPIPAVCANASPFALTGGLPVGGEYFGPGIIQGLFDPQGIGAGNYLIGYTTQNANGCRDTAFQQLQVYALPLAQTQQGDTAYYCPGFPIQLQAVTATGLSYAWLKDGQLLAGQQAANLLTSGPGFYQLLVNNANNCADTSQGVRVIELPGVQAQLTAMGNTTFCAGDQLLLKANTAAGYSYQWLKDGQLVTAQTTDSLWVNQAGAYRVVITNSQGCFDTSAVISIQINARPLANTTPTGTASFCEGDSLQINANTGTGLSYQWLLNGIAIAGANQSSIRVGQAGFYRVVVTNSSNCEDTSAVLEVLQNNRPFATISPANNDSTCQDTAFLLTANTGTGFIYQWLRNNVTIVGANQATLQANQTGDYRVLITNAAGCSDTSSVFRLTVMPKPAPPVISQQTDTLLSNSAMGIRWYRDGQLIAGQTDSILITNLAGRYVATLTSAFGCQSDSSNALVILSTSIENQRLLPLKIYPNPGNGHFELMLEAVLQHQLSVFNSHGQLVHRQKLLSGELVQKLDLTKLADGLYLVQIDNSYQRFYGRIIIQR